MFESLLENNQSEPEFPWCFPEPQQASTGDCRPALVSRLDQHVLTLISKNRCIRIRYKLVYTYTLPVSLVLVFPVYI